MYSSTSDKPLNRRPTNPLSAQAPGRKNRPTDLPALDAGEGSSSTHAHSSPLGETLGTRRVSRGDRTRRTRATAPVKPVASTGTTVQPLQLQPSPFQAARQQYGTTLDRIEALPGAFYAPSASADLALNGLNDHDGVLVVPARDGVSAVAERFAVVKENIDGTDCYFIKGQGDRAVPFEAFEQVLQQVNARTPAEADARRDALKTQLQQALGCKPWEDPLLETPLRSEVLALSVASPLTFRRNDKESDDKLMPLPPNPTAFPKRVSWANSENALCPGAGPMLTNGTRLYQLDWNRVENRLMGFKNNSGDVARDDSIMADSVPGHKAPVLVDGPVLFELSGIKRWQLVGPANEQSGVKGGGISRLGSAAGGALKAITGHGGNVVAEGGADELDGAMHKLKPGAHMRITTEDGVVHELMLDGKGMSLSMDKSSAGPGSAEAKAAFGVGMDLASAAGDTDRRRVRADVNVYSYQGRYTGRHSTPDGLPDPKLVLSTGEALKAGPLKASTNDLEGIAQAVGRVVLYQPNLGGPGGGARARITNVAVLAAAKFGTTALSAMADQAMRGPDGVHIHGATRFTGVGSGQASIGTLAGSTAAIVVAQELTTALKEAILPAIPENWQRPSNDYARGAVTFLGTLVEEMARLELNLGLQKAMKLREGAAWDHGTLAISSALKAVLETVKDNIGGREARPYMHMAIDGAESLQYMLLRITGMVMSEPPGEAGRLTNFNEAARTRVNLRLYDQVLAPIFTHLLNAQGILGENPDPFDHQIARERMIHHFGTKLKKAMAQAVEGNFEPLGEMVKDKGVLSTVRANVEQLLLGRRQPEDTEFFSDTDLRRERVKQLLNRVDLMTESLNTAFALFGSIYTPLRDKLFGAPRPDPLAVLEAGNPDHRVGRAIEMQTMRDDRPLEPLAERQRTHLQATVQAQDARILGAIAYEQAAAGQAPTLPAGARRPTTNSLSEASRQQQAFERRQHAQLQGKHAALPKDADGNFALAGLGDGPLQAGVPQPTGVDFAQRARPAAGKTSTLGVPPSLRSGDVHKPGVPVDQVPKDVGTFNTQLQAASLPRHVPMTRAGGLHDLLKNRPAGNPVPAITEPLAFNGDMHKRIEQSVRDYTVESQFFHYPLRWPVTGEPQYLNIVPGVQVPYNVLNKPGNVKGAKHERVDPIEALYANIGCARAEKFPADLLRAVVTEAAYKAPTGAAEDSGEIHAGGSKGVLTEIFSASASEAVAAQFNLPISGFGAVPRDRSQRLDLTEETGVNVSTLSDLAQAEVILMPGAVFSVKHVDANAGKPPRPVGAATPQDIGQVVYMEEEDTYALEKAFDDHLPYLQRGVGNAPPDRTLMVHPETGQFMRYTKAPQPGDKLYDPASGKFAAFDPAHPPRRGGFKFVSETRNYFLGKPLEFDSAPDQQALWRHPYAGDSAKRSTKDAIHAAILRGAASDPIVAHLDEAVKNLHHEHFRRKGGFYETRVNASGDREYVHPRARAEAAATARTKRDAATIAGENLAAGRFDQTQSAPQTEMLAWSTASMLRTPITLLPVGSGSGLPPEGISIHETYDKVDLLAHPLDRKPDPAVVIGVGADGYYAMRLVGDHFEPTHRVEGASHGLTAENFMHAYLRAGPSPKDDYVAVPSEEEGEPPTYVPSDSAAASGQALFSRLCGFAATKYIVLQEAMVKRHDEAQVRAAAHSGSPSGSGDDGVEAHP